MSKPFTLKAETRPRTSETHERHLQLQQQWSEHGRHTRVLLFGHSHIERLLRHENGVKLPFDWFVAGVGGDRFCHALWRLHKSNTQGQTFLSGFKQPPEQCILWIGNNGINMMPSDPARRSQLPSKFESSWTTLIREIQQTIPIVHVVSLVQGKTPDEHDDFRRELNDVLQEVCKKMGAHYLPLCDVLTSPDMYVEDGVHFNADGYRVIMRAFQERCAAHHAGS